MPRRGTDYARLAAAVQFGLPDGGPTRPVHRWTVDKLAILAYYVPVFADICTRNARGWYFVDAFAGCGVNDVAGEYWYKGSALVGMAAKPSPNFALLVEADPVQAEGLRPRAAGFGVPHHVATANANAELPALMQRHLTNRHLPGFVVLDPEGLELAWSTVEAVATHRSQRYTPYELLVYFSTPGTARMGGLRGSPHAEQMLTQLFGNDSWRSTWIRYQSGELRPGEAGARYRSLYCDQLRGLGYEHVIERPVPTPRGTLVYHLLLATNDKTGARLLNEASERAFLNNLPLPRP